MIKTLIIVSAVVVIGIIVLVGTFPGSKQVVVAPTISTYEECLAVGNAILESYPEQCRTTDGRTFVRDIGNELDKQSLILASYPRPGDAVGSPLSITGTARGYWFFEATFPVKMLDKSGAVIGSYYAQAQGEWMTEDFVPFTSTLTFQAVSGEKGTLILQKDNPSGLPENDDELRIPIIFN